MFTLAGTITNDDSPVDRCCFDQIVRDFVIQKGISGPIPWLYRLTLPRFQAEALCLQLAREGITRAALFPDFYGVVESLREARRLFARITQTDPEP